ncbi:hypothetical protein ACFQ0G_51880 [Streptomyces chiangmaiensis]
MAVIDRQWWGLWWPWLIVWCVTVVCWAVLIRHALVRQGWLRRRRRRSGRTVHGMCFFLHEKRVMGLYQTGGFSAALEQEVADRINVTGGLGLWGKLGFGSAGARRDVTKERVTAYIQKSTPITVIRLLMDTMRKEDVVVDVDLTTGLLVPNRALAESLRDQGLSDRVPLTAVMSEFVSVTGRFTAQGGENGEIVLRADYGDQGPPTHVRITCEAAGVREEFQDEEYFSGEFQARCLGKVRTWNRRTGS